MMGDDYLAMFHHLLFVMSLSGSIVFLVYGLTYPIARKYFPQSWRKHILCLSLFFYIAPLPLLKEFIISRLKIEFFPKYENVHIDLKYTINIQNNQPLLGPGVVIVYIFVFCIAVITSVIIIKQLKRYITLYRTYLLKAFYEIPPPQLDTILLQTKEELQIEKPVRLICSRLCDTPMTIGVFSPTIIFPPLEKLNLNLIDYKLIVKHELLHIKSKDLLLKFLALFVLAVHWYNPICYLLYFELCVVSEMNCDYGVIKGTNDIQRQRYSQLILELAAASGKRTERFAVGLANNEAATFERRILEMKEPPKNTKPILSCIVMVLICIVGTITTFAYEAPKKYVTDESNWEDEVTFSVSDSTESVEQLAFDYFFTDKDGHVTALYNLPKRILCKHDYVEGTVTRHSKKSDGGCTVTVKSAKMCKYCGDTIEGGIISKTEYTVCPH